MYYFFFSQACIKVPSNHMSISHYIGIFNQQQPLFATAGAHIVSDTMDIRTIFRLFCIIYYSVMLVYIFNKC